MKRLKRIFFTLIFAVYSFQLWGQLIEINAKDQPLDQVLLELSNRYGINISFDNTLTSNYKITLNGNFKTAEEAFLSLLRKLPLDYELKNNVYLIFPASRKTNFELDSLTFLGAIFDKFSYEPLPYSLICINNKYMYSDAKGNFTYREKKTDTLNIAITYLGYEIIDTCIAHESLTAQHEFFLEPSSVNIEEVTVNKNLVIEQPVIGRETGKVKLNAQVAHYLPGIGDNSLFQGLSLMPGISQISGGGSGFSIWGGSPDNVVIEFDGIRIYNSSHFYGNIGMINPLAIKDIEVYKGVTPADYCGAESGLIKLTGKMGNRIKPSATVEINNLTINALLETPAGPRNTLLIAMRGMYRNPEKTIFFKQNFDNLYAPDLPGFENDPMKNIRSNYIFGDAQLKFSGTIGNDKNYYINLYQSYDQSTYTPDSASYDPFLSNKLNQETGNSGAVFFFEKYWNKKISTDIHAGLSTNFETIDYKEYYRNFDEHKSSIIESSNNNRLWDFMFKNTQAINLFKNHGIKTGVGANFYIINNSFESNDTLRESNEDQNLVTYLFFQDKINLGKAFIADAGFRLSYSPYLHTIHFSPNISLTSFISNSFSVGLNYMHNQQFISKIPMVFSQYTQQNYYMLSGLNDIPVVESDNFSTSLNYISPVYCITVEAWYKLSDNIAEYVPEQIQRNTFDEKPDYPVNIVPGIYLGDSYSRGISLYNKFRKGNFSAWASYTLNESKRRIPELYGDRYIESINYFNHELKGAAILQTGKFAFSATYTYGSGRSLHGFTQENPDNTPPSQTSTYNRLDLSSTFKFSIRKFDFETGVSVLNVFNSKNFDYLYIRPGNKGSQSSVSNNIYYEINSLPRSVCFYLKFKF